MFKSLVSSIITNLTIKTQKTFKNVSWMKTKHRRGTAKMSIRAELQTSHGVPTIRNIFIHTIISIRRVSSINTGHRTVYFRVRLLPY